MRRDVSDDDFASVSVEEHHDRTLFLAADPFDALQGIKGNHKTSNTGGLVQLGDIGQFTGETVDLLLLLARQSQRRLQVQPIDLDRLLGGFASLALQQD